MNDTLQAINEIVRILDEGQNPAWLSYLSALGPLILTAISVFIACRQHRQNQNLQKQIADRDYRNILRQNMLAIYSDFFNGLRVVYQAVGNVADVFSTAQSLDNWGKELQAAYEQITASYNRAKIMLEDDDLVAVLKRTYYCFVDLYNECSLYINSAIAIRVIEYASEKISKKYHIESELGIALNPTVKEEYLSLCNTDQVKKIHGLMQAYIEAMADDNFDVYFKKYVQLEKAK